MVIYENQYVTISLERELLCVVQRWRGFCPAKDFRKAIDFTMDYLAGNGLYRIISDVSLQKIIPPSEQEYVRKKVLAFIDVFGKLKMAFVAPSGAVSKICVEAYDKKSLPGEDINRIFATMDAAVAWIGRK